MEDYDEFTPSQLATIRDLLGRPVPWNAKVRHDPNGLTIILDASGVEVGHIATDEYREVMFGKLN